MKHQSCHENWRKKLQLTTQWIQCYSHYHTSNNKWSICTSRFYNAPPQMSINAVLDHQLDGTPLLDTSELIRKGLVLSLVTPKRRTQRSQAGLCSTRAVQKGKNNKKAQELPTYHIPAKANPSPTIVLYHQKTGMMWRMKHPKEVPHTIYLVMQHWRIKTQERSIQMRRELYQYSHWM